MNIRAIGAGWRPFRLDQIAPRPWRNGGGLTRAIAADGGDADFGWRVSVADIERDGAFSRFPGVDRVAILIGGRDLTLDGAGVHIALRQRGDLAGFPGEAPIAAALGAGPARLLNVMTRRCAARCAPRVHTGEAVELDGAPHVCLVLDGVWRLLLADAVVHELGAGEGIVVSAARPDMRLLPDGVADRLVSIRIAAPPSAPPSSPRSSPP